MSGTGSREPKFSFLIIPQNPWGKVNNKHQAQGRLLEVCIAPPLTLLLRPTGPLHPSLVQLLAWACLPWWHCLGSEHPHSTLLTPLAAYMAAVGQRPGLLQRGKSGSRGAAPQALQEAVFQCGHLCRVGFSMLPIWDLTFGLPQWAGCSWTWLPDCFVLFLIIKVA